MVWTEFYFLGAIPLNFKTKETPSHNLGLDSNPAFGSFTKVLTSVELVRSYTRPNEAGGGGST